MFKKLLTFYKPHKKLFAVDMLCAFFVSIIDLAFPIIVSYVVDKVIPQGNMKIFVVLTIAVLVGYVFRYFFEYIVVYCGHMLGVRIEQGMRKELFSHIQKLSFTYFDNTKTGNIISRVINDLFDVSEFSHHGPEDLFFSFAMLFGSFIIMLFTNVKLTLVIFAIVPLMLFSTIRSNMKMTAGFSKVRRKNADLTARVEDSISGIRVVKAFSNEAHEIKKFNESNEGYINSRIATYKMMGRYSSTMYFFSNLLNLAVVFYGGFLIFKGEISYGVLVQFLLYVSVFIQPVKRFITLVEDCQKAIAGYRRCYQLLMTHPDIEDAPDSIKAENIQGQVQFKNVSFRYSDSDTVIKHLNLTFEQGKTTAIVGPSGAGKTTLCSLIPRFYDITQGAIEIDGTDIRHFTLDSLREQIGIVQQDVFLFNGSIRENISYGKLQASDEEVEKAAKFANLHDFILTLPEGYDTIVVKRGVNRSCVQKQRVSIARIFLKNPPILILDEATSSLDNENEKIIQHSFEKLSENRTTIVIAHRLQTIENADRIVVMTEDGIQESGTHQELLTADGVYAKLYYGESF